jgi:hypothetical protein
VNTVGARLDEVTEYNGRLKKESGSKIAGDANYSNRAFLQVPGRETLSYGRRAVSASILH